MTFFCTFDAVELYPIIPYKEVLEAILETLDKQEGQNVLTDSLILFTECVLENHFSHKRENILSNFTGQLSWLEVTMKKLLENKF